MDKKTLIAIITAFLIFLGIGLFLINKPEEVILQGEVDAKTYDVSSKINARVDKIYVEKGQKVKAGEILITLDTPDIKAKVNQSEAALMLANAQKQKVYNGARTEQISVAQSSLKQAQAQADFAQKTYKRMKKLHSEGVISSQKMDEAQAKYIGAQRAVEGARSQFQLYNDGERYEDKEAMNANVQRAQGALLEVNSYLKENKLKSPAAGEIVEISAEKGELIGAGYPLMTILDNDNPWVTFNIKEDLLSKIKMGDIIYAKFPALNNREIPLKVNYICVLGNFATYRGTKAKGDFDLKTFEIRAEPINKQSDLRIGMSAIVNWNKIKAKK